MKRTPLKRGTKQMKRSPLKPSRKPKTAPRRHAKGRCRLPSVKTMRNKCDALLTPIIKKMYPTCELTGAPTEVAHHFIKKSKSNALRYYIPNLIPLTHGAHQALHDNESYYSGILIQKRGLEWFEDLEREKRRTLKIDVHYYLAEYERLSRFLQSLGTGEN